ncbi:MAG: DUF4974 domain-containing protein [Muribaculaceae bacterium]|nr:DUF4974 domain-containing protein [Muribaculaceae bacterium]
MDKYELVLDIIGHPEKYSSGELQELLSDAETREIYTLLCKTESAIKSGRQVDVDAEWARFSLSHAKKPRRTLRFFGSRAASVAVVISSSLVALAAGIMITVNITDRRTVAAEGEHEETRGTSSIAVEDSITGKTDTIPGSSLPIMFENETLETIMKVVAERYGVKVKFVKREAASLHLYHKLDTSLPLDEVISRLNTFEQINIRRSGETLIID